MASFCFDTCVATTLLVYYGAALRDLDQQLRISELQTVTGCISLCDLLTAQINSGVIDVGTHARHLIFDLPSIFERWRKYAVCGAISCLFSITKTD